MSEEKKVDATQEAFEKDFLWWSGERPESVELDAIKLIAWEFYRRGFLRGITGPISEVNNLLRTLAEQQGKAQGGW